MQNTFVTLVSSNMDNKTSKFITDVTSGKSTSAFCFTESEGGGAVHRLGHREQLNMKIRYRLLSEYGEYNIYPPSVGCAVFPRCAVFTTITLLFHTPWDQRHTFASQLASAYAWLRTHEKSNCRYLESGRFPPHSPFLKFQSALAPTGRRWICPLLLSQE